MATKTEQRVVELIVNGTKAGASIRELGKDMRTLQAHVNGLTPGTKDFVEASGKLRQVKAQWQALRDEVAGTSKGLGLFKGNFASIMAGVTGGNLLTQGFQKFTQFIGEAWQGALKLSDQLADIQKTTGMSADEAKELNKQLLAIDTRTATEDLREIAITAGQLGIAKKDIASFTEATDKLNVALGDEFADVEEITKNMGALRNIFSDIKTDKIDSDMLRIGNAINELGASGMATGPVVSDFANRIGSVGIPLGLTSDEVLGLSATLQELNVATERGGTAINKILLKMTNDVEGFAKVAGMNVTDFRDLVNKDLFGAFMKVVEGSQKSATSATQFSAMLDKLQIDGAGTSEVFAKLSNNTGMLEEKVTMAGDALQGTDSIMAEFNTKNETLAARVERVKKAFDKLITTPVIEFLTSAAETVFGLVGSFDEVQEEVNDVNKDFAAQAKVVKDLETNVRPLITRYEELKGKTQLTKDEQAEMNTIMTDLQKFMPGIIEQVDEYGNVLSINTGMIDQYIERQKLVLKGLNQELILKHELTRATLLMQKQSLEAGNLFMLPDGADKSYKGVQKAIEDINKQLAITEATIDNLSGDDLELKMDRLNRTGLNEEEELAALAKRRDIREKEIKETIDEEISRKYLLKQMEEQYQADITSTQDKWKEIRKKKANEGNTGGSTPTTSRPTAAPIEKVGMGEIPLVDTMDPVQGIIENIHARMPELRTAVQQVIDDVNQQLKDSDEELRKQKAEKAVAIIQQVQAGLDAMESVLNEVMRQQTVKLDHTHQKQLSDLKAKQKQELESHKLTSDEKIALQETHAAEIAALEEKQALEQKELKKKQANIELGINISKIVAATALAVAQSIAASPMTFGMPWAAINAGAGAVQLGIAIAQRASLNQFEEGGFTSKGNPSEIAGIVHKNEWVAPSWMMNDPVTFSTISMLEGIRQQRGFAQGGFTGQPSTGSGSAPAQSNPPFGLTQPTPDNSMLLAVLQENTTAVRELRARLAQPIYGVWDFDYFDERYTEVKALKDDNGI